MMCAFPGTRCRRSCSLCSAAPPHPFAALKHPVQTARIRPGSHTGCGAAWQRACFGSRRSGVQIPASRRRGLDPHWSGPRRPVLLWSPRLRSLWHTDGVTDPGELVDPPPSGGQVVLLTLGAAQFLMTLDSSVMNVSIATVAKDAGTTVTGIQLAITLYTLVMAAFMITGGKVGQIIGRKRVFMIGSVIYACGSLTTALAGSLPVLLLG